MLNKKLILSLLMISVFITSFGCSKRPVPSFSGTGFYFDTVISVNVYGNGNEDILEGLWKKCGEYENIFSAAKEGAELYNLNERARLLSNDNCSEPFEISEDLFKCIKKSKEYCEITDGSYDITIRPVSALWDFKSDNKNVPDNALIKEKLDIVGYDQISISEDNGKYFITYTAPKVEIELGSSAKGYIGDRLLEYLDNRGVHSAIISLGGNVQCLGYKQTDFNILVPFKVAIKDPLNDGSVYETLEVNDMAVVTSGVYERCFEKDGRLYHHILDAHTGMPLETDLVSVTVISPSGLMADILSTVCFISGYDKSMELIKNIENTEVEFVFGDGSVRHSEGFEAYIVR